MSVSIFVGAVIAGERVAAKSKLIDRPIERQEKVVTCDAVLYVILGEFRRLTLLEQGHRLLQLLYLKDFHKQIRTLAHVHYFHVEFYLWLSSDWLGLSRTSCSPSAISILVPSTRRFCLILVEKETESTEVRFIS